MVTAKPSLELVAEVLNGHPRSISRLISRVEARDPECRPALAQIYEHTGHAHLIGITGVPGSGKSTLVRELALAARKTDRTIGIIAIDPSSPFSGGAILGDRIRMNELTGDPGIFIRSMATRGALGGLARASLDAVDLLDAAGFDMILLETVGVGQDEVDIVQAAHTTVVVSAPGLGDDVQAMKAGLLEISDIHVVSKCDRADANKTVTDLKAMLSLGLRMNSTTGWQPPVVRTSAEAKEGIDELLAAIDRHREHLQQSGELAQRRRRTAEMRMLKTAEDILRARFISRDDDIVVDLVERVITRALDPYTAALNLLATLDEGKSDDGGKKRP
jgi:LAO/AO transport system kinase